MARTTHFPIFARILLLFTVIPLLELIILLWLASVTSWGFTLVVVLVSGFLGAMMIKRQGLEVLRRARGEASSGRFPAGALFDGVLLVIGGALLLTPGILTDIVGFSTLIPPVRELYKRALKKSFAGKFQASFSAGSPGAGFHFFTSRGPAAPPPRPAETPRESVEGTGEEARRGPWKDESPFDRAKR
jgi:UPF0716 protein FxsA